MTNEQRNREEKVGQGQKRQGEKGGQHGDADENRRERNEKQRGSDRQGRNFDAWPRKGPAGPEAVSV